MTRDKLLSIDIHIYNKAMEIQYKKDKVKKNLSGDLKVCKDCGRKKVIWCICDVDQKRFIEMTQEVRNLNKITEDDEDEKLINILKTEGYTFDEIDSFLKIITKHHNEISDYIKIYKIINRKIKKEK